MIGGMYVTLMSVIFAGTANMVFTKTGYYKKHYSPIDGGKVLSDGKRLFGDNKTWSGFFAMILLNAFFQALWGAVCHFVAPFEAINELYSALPNIFITNFAVGALLGFAYVICELPNSFIKRRLNITPGKTDRGVKGIIFFLIDQIDSLLGVSLVLAIICNLTIGKYLLYVILGGATHIAINLILYALKIRKNI